MQLLTSFSGKNFFIFQLPLLLVAASLLLFGFNISQNLMSSDQFNLISNISFFNQTHVLLTFFTIFSLGHYAEWRSKAKINGVSVARNISVAFLLFFILSQALYFDLFSLGAFESTSIFLFIVRVYGTQHFLFQSYGFSNYLNLGFDLNNVSTKSESLILQAKIEHQNLKLVFLSFFFVDIAATFLAKPQLKLYFYLAILAGIAISTIALLKIFRSITHLPEELKLKKIVFCSRYFLYPLKSLSLWLGLGAVIIHSCEYIYFVNHSFKEEYGANALPAKKIYFFLFCEIAFIVPLIFMNSNQLLFQMAIAGTWWFTVIRGLVNSLILVHFYTDGLAYSRKTNPYSHGLFKFDSLAQNLIK